MASIKKREGKRGTSYLITVSLGRDENDKKIFETTTYTPTATGPKAIEKEVAAFAHDFEKRVKEGKYLPGEKLTYKEIAKRWKAEWAVDHLADQGAQYMDIIERYGYPAFGNMVISKIRPLHVQDIFNRMKEKGLSAVTIRKTQSALNSVFRYAYRMSIIQDNPCDRLERPRIDKDTDLHYFTPEQAKIFLRTLSAPYTEKVKAHSRTDDTGKPYSVPAYEMTRTLPLQHQVYFYLAVYGGFRRGELCALTWRDINFENHTVSINKAVARRTGGQIIKSPKTVAGNRIVKLPKICFEMLRKWQWEESKLRMSLGTAWNGPKDPDDYFIFIQSDGSLIDISSIRKRFLEIIRRYNSTCENEADKLPEIKLHDLRHTAATLLVAKGCDYATISHRLGHSKISVTLDIYSHPLPENDSVASEILEEILAIPS